MRCRCGSTRAASWVSARSNTDFVGNDMRRFVEDDILLGLALLFLVEIGLQTALVGLQAIVLMRSVEAKKKKKKKKKKKNKKKKKKKKKNTHVFRCRLGW